MQSVKTAAPVLLALAIFSLALDASAAEPPAVEIFPASGQMQPGTTLEFRFPAAMVASTDLGPATNAPVTLTPPMAGSFTWLSTRSGVFSPAGPLPLGGSWTVRLRDGLQDAAGQPVTAKLEATLTTPPFGVTAVNSGVWDDKAVAPDVEVKLAFALPVAPEASFFRFVDAAGKSVAADVRNASRSDYFNVPADAEDWDLRWRQLANPDAGQGNEDDTIASRLIIRPATPLPAAEGWKLVVSAGLPSTVGGQKLTAPYELPLGAVPPFTVRTVEAANYINSGPTLNLEFSSGLAPDIDSDSAAKFFTIDPAPEGLTWEVSYGTVMARGKFALDRDYKLTIGQDVVSSAGAPFDGPRERTVRFSPVPPRLYLPELTMAQILGGRRVLPVRSVNLASLSVKATLLPDDQAARAWNLFQQNEWTYEEGTPVPVGELKGKKLTDEEIKLEGAAIDARQTTDLDWTRILGGKKAGVILLELQGKPLEGTGTQQPAAQALIVLSDLGVLWKKADDGLRLHIFSTATGAPVAGAKARILASEFDTLARGTTDERGDALLKFPSPPSWLVVSKGEDTCVLPMGPSADMLRIGDWFSGQWAVTPQGNPGARAMMFTDRPLYQPGETARIKGYVRTLGPEGFSVGAGQELTLILRNPEYNEVARTTVKTDARGAFEGAFEIPFAPLGNYVLQAGLDGNDSLASASFIVAAYQPDAFEVTLDMPSEFAAGAAGPRATIDGSYFFGGRLTDAEVRWTLTYSAREFSPTGYESFTFLRALDDGQKALTLRGEARIGADQPAVIEPQLPTPALGPAGGTLVAEVTDINQQTVSAEVNFTRQSSDFYLGIDQPDSIVARAGQEMPLSFIAVKPDGSPVAEPLDVSVNIRRVRQNVVRVLGAGGAMTFRRDTTEEPLLEQKAQTVLPVKRDQAWSVDEKESLRFTPPGPGNYRLRVTARDAGGREVASETSFYAEGEGAVVWDYGSPYEVTLVADKETYLPGETARVLVKTPIEGEAFVSIEQGGEIRRDLRLPLTGNAPVLEIPISESDAPSVSVALVIVRGADASKRKFPAPEFRFGSCQLTVEQPGAHLKVAVEPATDAVLPGAEVVTTVTVTDAKGQPVPQAGVAFYAVDDSILALTGFQRPEPADVFLAPVSTRVMTGLSLADLLPEDPEDIEFSNKGYLIGGGGDGGPVSLRENFPGTATWQPSLVTGEDGRVTARFTAPDALTRYRLVAVADSGALSFGSGESAVKIARPLMILPSVGQFANAGDDLVARAVIRNETGQDGTVQVSFTTPAGTQQSTVQVAQGASAAADFPLKFAQPGPASLEWSATMKAGDTEFADRVKIDLPVGSPMLRLRETYFSELDAKSNDLMQGVNPQIAEGTGDVVVTVANTRLAGLARQARFLSEYPYGCAEQTVSSFVPWVVMPELGSVLPDFARDPEEVRRITEKTLADIFALQTPDGGLAFWPGGGLSSPFASAWAGIVLSRVQQQGTTMPAGWNRLLEYLAKSLRGLDPKLPPSELAEKTFAALALATAGRPEASYHEELYRRRAELPAEARAILAIAILKAGGAREMAADLLKPDPSAPEDVSPFGGATRDRAIRLLAWSNFEPKNPEVAKLLAEVLAFGPQNRDGTTQSSAWTLLALADYRAIVEKPGRTKGTAKGSIVAGAASAPFAVDAKQPAVSHTFPLTGTPGTALKVENPSAAKLYGEASFSVYPPLGEQPRQDRGFAVSRSYRKIAADGSLQPAEDLRVGDRVVVTIRVEAERPTFFVAVDDPLPSILEAVNPDFISRGVGGASASESSAVSHREMRADRVLYFCDALPAGPHIFEYLARVRMAGDSTAAATKAEAMYRPERFGLGETSRLASRPAQVP